jgi:hypothetical protein
MGVMNQTVKDRIGESGVANTFMPMFNGQLTGHEGGGMTVSVLNDLQEFPSFRVCQGSQSEVIDQQE